jgi:hypothetical protein
MLCCHMHRNQLIQESPQPRSTRCHCESLDSGRSTKGTPLFRMMHLEGLLKANGTLFRAFVFLNWRFFTRSINVVLGANRKF